MGNQVALHIDRNYRRQAHIVRNLKRMGFEMHKADITSKAEELVKKNYYRLVLVDLDIFGNDTLFTSFFFQYFYLNSTYRTKFLTNATTITVKFSGVSLT